MALLNLGQAMVFLLEKISGSLVKKPVPSLSHARATRLTSATNPYMIKNPSLGILNLIGEGGSELYKKDIEDLSSSFPENINFGFGQVPKCNVLFVYCTLEPSGRIVGQPFSLNDVVKASGAHIAVVASENPANVLTSTKFGQFITSEGDWPANVIITVYRNGDMFGQFFQKLFTEMHEGVTMPLAWVKLAPQGPIGQDNCPTTIAFMKAGHITFKHA